MPKNKPFICEVCGHGCKSKAGLLGHMRVKHKDSSPLPSPVESIKPKEAPKKELKPTDKKDLAEQAALKSGIKSINYYPSNAAAMIVSYLQQADGLESTEVINQAVLYYGKAKGTYPALIRTAGSKESFELQIGSSDKESKNIEQLGKLIKLQQMFDSDKKIGMNDILALKMMMGKGKEKDLDMNEMFKFMIFGKFMGE